MITLYHCAAARSFRPLWALEELARERRPLSQQAAIVARAFDRVVIYEDVDLRGREPGEMTKLISSALAEVRPEIRYVPAASMEEAVTLGLALAAPADPVLVVYEELEPVLALLGRLGAERSEGVLTGARTS